MFCRNKGGIIKHKTLKEDISSMSVRKFIEAKWKTAWARIKELSRFQHKDEWDSYNRIQRRMIHLRNIGNICKRGGGTDSSYRSLRNNKMFTKMQKLHAMESLYY